LQANIIMLLGPASFFWNFFNEFKAFIYSPTFLKKNFYPLNTPVSRVNLPNIQHFILSHYILGCQPDVSTIYIENVFYSVFKSGFSQNKSQNAFDIFIIFRHLRKMTTAFGAKCQVFVL